MMMVCPICGKRFFCQPEFWPYWRGDYYLCSENCKIVFDTKEFREKSGWIDDHYRKKEEKEVHKITLAQKKKAVDIAIGGGNPLKYLEDCGSANPSAHWYYIKKTLKGKDPEKYEQITKGMKIQLKDEAPEDKLDGFEPFEMKDGRRKVTTCCAPSTREGVEVPEELPEFKQDIGRSAEILEKTDDGLEKEPVKPEVVLTIKSDDLTMEPDETPNGSTTKPVNYDGFEVMALKSPDTGFRFASDPRYGMMTWNTISGDEVSLTAEEWRKLASELPKVLQIFGI